MTVAVISGLVLAGFSNNGTIAKSSAGTITKEDLYEHMKEFYGGQVLEKLVLEQILSKDYTVKDGDVDHVVKKYQQQYGAQFNTILRQRRQNEAQFRMDTKLNLLIDKAIEKQAKITDEDLKAYYETWEPKIMVSHILAGSEGEAKDGGDFVKLAKERSLDYTTRETGGKLEPFGPGELPEAFEKASYALKEKGEFSAPVESTYGWSVIRLDEPAIKESFEKEKKEVLEDYVKGLATETKTKELVVEAVKAADVKIEDEKWINVNKVDTKRATA